MKFFLNDKIIELVEPRPLDPLPDELVMEYKSARRLKKAYHAFEKDALHRKLVFWSEKKSNIWRQEFTRLFKRIEAAGGLVKNEKGEFLFIFRLGKWDLPKGKLSGKETAEQAAIREVMEETGLTGLRITGVLPATHHIFIRKGREILKRTWWFEMEAGSDQSLVPQTEEQITDVRWIGKDRVYEVLGNTYPSIRELLKSEQ